MTEQQKILHLYRRLGFGLPLSYWTQPQITLSQHIERLFTQGLKPQTLRTSIEDQPDEDQNENDKRAKRKLAQEGMLDLQQRWLKQMAQAENPLLEKMALFWHGHFACIVKRPRLAQPYLQVLREQALGDFKTLLLQVSQTPAMMRFLNTPQNKRGKPNENFARELLELFTLGRGHYTEKDIKEAARAFTGWSINPKENTFAFRLNQHDMGSKKFMGHTGNFKGIDILNIVLSKPRTAEFISQKLYRFFVNEHNIIESQVKELAQVLFKSNYDLKKTMRYLVETDWFYAPEHLGAQIKSPVALMAELMQQLRMSFEHSRAHLPLQRGLGQVLFQPPNVAGWPGGKAWIDNATLLFRLGLPAYLLQQTELSLRIKELPEEEHEAPKGKLALSLDWSALQAACPKGLQGQALFLWLAERLLPLPPPKGYTLQGSESFVQVVAAVLGQQAFQLA